MFDPSMHLNIRKLTTCCQGASHADDKLDDEEFERRMKAALPNALAYVNSEGMKWEGLDEE